MLEINHITVRSEKITQPLTFAVCPDFHNGDVDLVLSACRGADAMLVAGDLVDRHDHRTNGFDNAVRFLQEAPDVAPVFYAIGNHERKLKTLKDYWPHVEKSRVTVLDDHFVTFGGIVLGGLSSRKEGPQCAWLSDMAAQPGFKLLMCHHPEYYKVAVLNRDIDLTIAGHAHGGQVRIPGIVNGLCAPNQGWFPKYAGGRYEVDGTTLIVSRGLSTQRQMSVPRIFNRPEIVVIDLE